MAEDKKAELVIRGVNIDVVQNGYKICVYRELKEKSLAVRAGWVPECSIGRPEEYVEKTKDAVLKRLKEIL